MQGSAEALITVVTVTLAVLSGLVVLLVLKFAIIRCRYRQAVMDVESDSQGNVV